MRCKSRSMIHSYSNTCMQGMDNPVLGFCKGVGTVSSLQTSSRASTTDDTMSDDESADSSSESGNSDSDTSGDEVSTHAHMQFLH